MPETTKVGIREGGKPENGSSLAANAYDELEKGIFAALETYSNVHRGSGHKSAATTFLYERAREIVLDYSGLDKMKYVVIFCTAENEASFRSEIRQEDYKSISSGEIGLDLGVRALIIRKRSLPGGKPVQAGGGTTRLVAPGWVVWAKAPDKFEAGTPAIINIIAFARALQMTKKYGKDIFGKRSLQVMTFRDILYHDDLENLSGEKLLEELRPNLIGNDIHVPASEGDVRYINLDNAASTQALRQAWDSFRNTLRQPLDVQKEVVNEVRKICAEVLGAPEAGYDIIFTSNTTEAINLVADSLYRKADKGAKHVVINTLIEHNSNDLPWRISDCISLIRMKTDDDGFIDPKELEVLLKEYNEGSKHVSRRIRLVALSGASNVLGVFNDLETISSIVHKYGAQLLVDGAQLVAHRKVEIEKTGIDYLAFSAHKVYAPFGTGMLVAKKGLIDPDHPAIEVIRRSGEENPAGIAALGKSLLLLQRLGFDIIMEEERALTKRALDGMAGIEGLQLYGISDPSSPLFTRKGGVIVFSLKKAFSNVISDKLALRGGIGTRYGCHCAHILIKHLVGVGPFLERFQHLIAKLFPVRFPGLARISLGLGNTEEDIDRFLEVLKDIAWKPDVNTGGVKLKMNEFVRKAAERVYYA